MMDKTMIEMIIKAMIKMINMMMNKVVALQIRDDQPLNNLVLSSSYRQKPMLIADVYESMWNVKISIYTLPHFCHPRITSYS